MNFCYLLVVSNFTGSTVHSDFVNTKTKAIFCQTFSQETDNWNLFRCHSIKILNLGNNMFVSHSSLIEKEAYVTCFGELGNKLHVTRVSFYIQFKSIAL